MGFGSYAVVHLWFQGVHRCAVLVGGREAAGLGSLVGQRVLPLLGCLFLGRWSEKCWAAAMWVVWPYAAPQSKLARVCRAQGWCDCVSVPMSKDFTYEWLCVTDSHARAVAAAGPCRCSRVEAAAPCSTHVCVFGQYSDSGHK